MEEKERGVIGATEGMGWTITPRKVQHRPMVGSDRPNRGIVNSVSVVWTYIIGLLVRNGFEKMQLAFEESSTMLKILKNHTETAAKLVCWKNSAGSMRLLPAAGDMFNSNLPLSTQGS